jgi:hypothetical protein
MLLWKCYMVTGLKLTNLVSLDTYQLAVHCHISILLGYSAVSLGLNCPAFQDHVKASSSRVHAPVKNWAIDSWRWGHYTVSKHQATSTQCQSAISQKNRVLNCHFRSLKTHSLWVNNPWQFEEMRAEFTAAKTALLRKHWLQLENTWKSL